MQNQKEHTGFVCTWHGPASTYTQTLV